MKEEILEKLREAHEAAYKAYTALSELYEAGQEDDDLDVDDLTFSSQDLEDLMSDADNLQSQLFDLISTE